MRTILACVRLLLLTAGCAVPAAVRVTAAEPPSSPKNTFDEAIQRNPRDPDAWLARGLKRVRSSHPEQAIEDFDHALALDPKNATAYDGRGSAYAALKDPIKAHEDFDRAIQADPQLASAYRHRADNWLRMAKVPLGNDIIADAWPKARKPYAERGFNSNNAPRQAPRNTESGPIGPIGLANLDRLQADQLDAQQASAYGDRAGAGAGGGGKGGAGGQPGFGDGESGNGEDGKGESGKGGGGKGGDGKGGDGKGGGGKGGDGKGGDGKGGNGGSGSAGGGGDGNGAAGRDRHTSGVRGRKKKTHRVVVHRHRPAVKTAAPADTPPVIVYPHSVMRGAPQTLFADADALAARMPAAPLEAKPDADAKEQPSSAREPLLAVDVYRGRQGQQKFDPAADELVAADVKGTPNFVAPLDTTALEPGDYRYFAVPKGAAGADGRPILGEPLSAVGQVRAEHAPCISAGAPAVVARDVVGVGGGVVGNATGVGGAPIVGYTDDELTRLEKSGRRDVAALRSWRDGDYPAAIAEYDRLLETDADNPVYVRERGRALLAEGRYDSAIHDYDKLLSSGTADADSYYNQGCAELASGRFDRAIDDFTASIKLNEKGAMAYNNRGAALAKKGDFRRALADFETALRLDPSDALAGKNRALAQDKLASQKSAAPPSP